MGDELDLVFLHSISSKTYIEIKVILIVSLHILISMGGLGVTVVPTLFSQLPESIRILTDNGIVLGSPSAVLLNIIFNMVPSRQEKQIEEKVSLQQAVSEA